MLNCSHLCTPVMVVVFLNWCASKKQSPDIAGGVHVGKDDLDVGAGHQGIMSGYAGDDWRDREEILMIGLDAGGKTTILYKLKLVEVITTIPGKKLTDVRKNGGSLVVVCWWCGRRRCCVRGAKSRLQCLVLDVAKLPRVAVEAVGKGKKAGGGGVPAPVK